MLSPASSLGSCESQDEQSSISKPHISYGISAEGTAGASAWEEACNVRRFVSICIHVPLCQTKGESEPAASPLSNQPLFRFGARICMCVLSRAVYYVHVCFTYSKPPPGCIGYTLEGVLRSEIARSEMGKCWDWQANCVPWVRAIRATQLQLSVERRKAEMEQEEGGYTGNERVRKGSGSGLGNAVRYKVK